MPSLKRNAFGAGVSVTAADGIAVSAGGRNRSRIPAPLSPDAAAEKTIMNTAIHEAVIKTVFLFTMCLPDAVLRVIYHPCGARLLSCRQVNQLLICFIQNTLLLSGISVFRLIFYFVAESESALFPVCEYRHDP